MRLTRKVISQQQKDQFHFDDSSFPKRFNFTSTALELYYDKDMQSPILTLLTKIIRIRFSGEESKKIPQTDREVQQN